MEPSILEPSLQLAGPSHAAGEPQYPANNTSTPMLLPPAPPGRQSQEFSANTNLELLVEIDDNRPGIANHLKKRGLPKKDIEASPMVHLRTAKLTTS